LCHWAQHGSRKATDDNVAARVEASVALWRAHVLHPVMEVRSPHLQRPHLSQQAAKMLLSKEYRVLFSLAPWPSAFIFPFEFPIAQYDVSHKRNSPEFSKEEEQATVHH